MNAPGRLVYMDKIAVAEDASGAIDLEAPVRVEMMRSAHTASSVAWTSTG